MILLDTSVVMVYLRTRAPELVAQFVSHGAAICGVTRAEALHGVRSPADHANTLANLATFRELLIENSYWDAVGDNLAVLRSVGVAVPFQDIVIATVAIAHGVELWARDRHFPLIAAHLPRLRLFAETPGGPLP